MTLAPRVVGCAHTPNTNLCDDLSACTTGDICTDGQCVGALTPGAITCNAGDGDPCNGAEACDPGTGGCLPGAVPTCDDNNACTDDSCIPFVGCSSTPNDLNACTDNNVCTTDSCSGGTCVATPTNCSNGDACDGEETCNPGTGLCDPGTAPNCDDFVACTQDSCDPSSGCVHGLPDGPEGIVCILDQMRTTLLESQFGSVSPKLKKRLNRNIDRTQKLYIAGHLHEHPEGAGAAAGREQAVRPHHPAPRARAGQGQARCVRGESADRARARGTGRHPGAHRPVSMEGGK
jgi:hypothetical protein